LINSTKGETIDVMLTTFTCIKLGAPEVAKLLRLVQQKKS